MSHISHLTEQQTKSTNQQPTLTSLYQTPKSISRGTLSLLMACSTDMASGLLSLVPVGDALAVKEDLSLESAVVTLRKLDGRDKFTKVLYTANLVTSTSSLRVHLLLLYLNDVQPTSTAIIFGSTGHWEYLTPWRRLERPPCTA